MRPLSDETADSYDVAYFLLPEAAERPFQLFKKVEHEGRARAEVFLLQEKAWRPATGLWPRVQGGEWDPSARSITSTDVWTLLEAEGWTTQDLIRILGAREGQRRKLRAT